jgi:hypothetical protein
MYGGYNTSTGHLGDTWSWDGKTWTQLHPATTGHHQPFWSAAYDAAASSRCSSAARKSARQITGPGPGPAAPGNASNPDPRPR